MSIVEEEEPWVCDDCLAACTFEAMTWCQRIYDPEASCAFDRDQPQAIYGVFDFVKRKEAR